jgi:hypothetical protein
MPLRPRCVKGARGDCEAEEVASPKSEGIGFESHQCYTPYGIGHFCRRNQLIKLADSETDRLS